MDLQSHPAEREYRTRLREAAKGKPSFAAYYFVAEWGCGSPCQQVALIDARSGAVHFAPFSTSLGNRHRLDSRLFIADAPEDISEYYSGKTPEDSLFTTTYWLWDETAKRFRPLAAGLIKKQTKSGERQPLIPLHWPNCDAKRSHYASTLAK